MKNYPFYGWVPKPAGVLVLLSLFVPLFFSGGTYLSNINEMAGGMGVLTEEFQFLSFCTSVGMAMVFPFMLSYLQARNVKRVYVGGYALLALLNAVCAVTQSIPLLAVCCFLIGFVRVALVLNTTFVIAPYLLGVNTIDMFLHEPRTPEEAYKGEHMRTILMPVIYCYILCIVQFSNYVSAWVAYEFQWQYTYFLVIGMLLTAMLIVLLTFCSAPTRRYNLPYFLLMLCANLYMYFHYQTMGLYEHSIPPTLMHYAGMLILYSVTCAFAMKRLPVRYFPTWLFLMVAVRNVVAPAIVTSVYGNWLQERQQHYVTRLAQDVRSDEPQASARFSLASRAGQAQGKDSFEAARLASTLMKGQLTLQATLVAMKDITGSTVWICVGSAALMLLLPYYKRERT